MPAKYFVVNKKADKQFLRLPRFLQKRIIDAYDVVQQNPLTGAKLHGELTGLRKYRVGDYRIIYQFRSKESRLEVIAIEHRQGVYK